MTAGQLHVNTDDGRGYIKTTRYYTSDESVNQLLNEYTNRADAETVWISIDGAGFRKNVLREEFTNLLAAALAQAFETCVATTSPQKRYLKIRSMNSQNKIFVKIRYSCEEPVMAGFDKRYHAMRDMVEQVDGYMRLQFAEEENILKIAVPI